MWRWIPLLSPTVDPPLPLFRSRAHVCAHAKGGPPSGLPSNARAPARARARTHGSARKHPAFPASSHACPPLAGTVRDQKYGTREAVELLAVCLVLNFPRRWRGPPMRGMRLGGVLPARRRGSAPPMPLLLLVLLVSRLVLSVSLLVPAMGACPPTALESSGRLCCHLPHTRTPRTRMRTPPDRAPARPRAFTHAPTHSAPRRTSAQACLRARARCFARARACKTRRHANGRMRMGAGSRPHL